MKIRAAVLREVGAEVTVEELQLAPPARGEVLVGIQAAGVCHSDYHVISGDAGHALPVVLGHEGAGVVLAVGDEVRSPAVGDRVALSWIPFCGACALCQNGHTNLCKAYTGPLWNGTMFDGTTRLTDASGAGVFHLSCLACWASHAVVPARSCVRISAELPMPIASIIGCAVTTGVGAVLNKARVAAGSSVVVYGAGGVGLSVVMAAALAGAAPIIVVDRAAAKATLARSLGATHFVHSGPQALRQIHALTGSLGADYAFEAVGNTLLEQQLMATVRPGGMAVMLGFPRAGSTFELDPAAVIRDEKTLTGALFGSAHTHRDFAQYGRLFLAGRLPVDRLITQTYSLEQINLACADMMSGEAGRGVILFA